MADEIIRLNVELPIDAVHLGALNRSTFPALAEAVQIITAAVHQRWSMFASGEPLPSGKVLRPRSGEYQRSIQTRELGDFAGEVFSELPYADAIETGTPARDMKTMLNSSMKVRVTKTGKRYLIIPFRHDVPGSQLSGSTMPAEVHRWWKQEGRQFSHIIGTYLRKSGTGAVHWRDGISPYTGQSVRKGQAVMVPGWRYGHHDAAGGKGLGFGSRLTTEALGELGFHKDDKVTKRLQGMVNFREPGKTGGAAQSRFITFRVMMEGSKGWIQPAREGLYPARSAAEQVRTQAERLFQAAVEQDIAAMVGGTVE